MSKDEFWGKKDNVSLARSLRLAVIQNVFGQGLLTEADARDLLKGPLEPNNPLTFYDDSDCLEIPDDA